MLKFQGQGVYVSADGSRPVHCKKGGTWNPDWITMRDEITRKVVGECSPKAFDAMSWLVIELDRAA